MLIGILSGVFGLEIDKAIGTALAAMCVVTIFGAVSHYREGHVAPRIGLIVGVTGIVGAALGAELGQMAPDRVLELGAGFDSVVSGIPGLVADRHGGPLDRDRNLL